MALKTPTCHHNGAVVKTEISIPWNAVVKDNPVINRDH